MITTSPGNVKRSLLYQYNDGGDYSNEEVRDNDPSYCGVDSDISETEFSNFEEELIREVKQAITASSSSVKSYKSSPTSFRSKYSTSTALEDDEMAVTGLSDLESIDSSSGPEFDRKRRDAKASKTQKQQQPPIQIIRGMLAPTHDNPKAKEGRISSSSENNNNNNNNRRSSAQTDAKNKTRTEEEEEYERHRKERLLNDIMDMDLVYNGNSKENIVLDNNEADADNNSSSNNNDTADPIHQSTNPLLKQAKELRFGFDHTEFHPGVQGLTQEEWHACWYTSQQIRDMEDANHAVVRALRQEQKNQTMEYKLAKAERERQQALQKQQQQQQAAAAKRSKAAPRRFSLSTLWGSGGEATDGADSNKNNTPKSDQKDDTTPPLHPIAILETALSTCSMVEMEEDMEHVSKLLQQEQKNHLLSLYQSSKDEDTAANSNILLASLQSMSQLLVGGGGGSGGNSKGGGQQESATNATNVQEEMQHVLGLERLILKDSRGTSLDLVRHMLEQPAFRKTALVETRRRRPKLQRRRTTDSSDDDGKSVDSDEYSSTDDNKNDYINEDRTARRRERVQARKEEKRARWVRDTSRASRLLAHELALVLHEALVPSNNTETTKKKTNGNDVQKEQQPIKEEEEPIQQSSKNASSKFSHIIQELVFSEAGAPLGMHLSDETLEVVDFGPQFVATCENLGLDAAAFQGAKIIRVHHDQQQPPQHGGMSDDEIWASLKDPRRPKTVVFRLCERGDQ